MGRTGDSTRFRARAKFDEHTRRRSRSTGPGSVGDALGGASGARSCRALRSGTRYPVADVHIFCRLALAVMLVVQV
jgi:hypothetical protein